MSRHLVTGVRSHNLGSAICAEIAVRSQITEIHSLDRNILDFSSATDEEVEGYMTHHGPFDYIVYSSGLNRLCWSKDLDIDEMIEIYRVNVLGFVQLLAAHQLIFPEQKFSAVAVVSDAAWNAMRGSLTYCSSKAALAQAVKVLARELAPHSRVNGVAPAVIADTPMSDELDTEIPAFRNWDPEKAKAYEQSLLPMGRRVNKDEVARVVCDVLYGPDYQTGSIVNITGGK